MMHLLRSAALLALFATGTSVFGWDETTTDEAAPADATQTPPIAEIDGRSKYSLPILQKRWENQAVLNVSRDKVAHITADEDVVVVQSTSGTVTVFNSESGQQLWSAKVGQTDEVAMKATTDTQLVAIVSGPVLHGFDKFSGQKLFGFRLPITASAEPLLTRRERSVGNNQRITRTVFVPLGDKSIVAYDLETLRYIGQHGALKKGVASPLLWRFAGGELITKPIVAGFDRLAMSTDAGSVIGVEMTGRDKGKTWFQFFMNSPTTAPLTVVTRDDREYLLAACENRRLFCIDLKSAGVIEWDFPVPRAITKPIICVGNDVFVVTADDEMFKFDLNLGRPVEVSKGTRAVLTQTENGEGGIPAYGAAVEIGVKGRLLLSPIEVSNFSTGQIVTSVQMNLGTCPSMLKFAVDENGLPKLAVTGDNGAAAGYRKAEISDDRRSIMLTFTDFQPGDEFHFQPEFEHDELTMADITDAHLVNADIRVTVTPLRASVASTDLDQVEPLSPKVIVGRMKQVNDPWKVTGVRELLAVSDSSVYFSDRVNNIVSVGRAFGTERLETAATEFTVRVKNELTDRIFVGTTNGRVVCFNESRIELSVMPLPMAGAMMWIPYPGQQLSAAPAKYHRNPENQPITVSVPDSDPATPAEPSAAAPEN
ncbi:MAG: PQQ-binding-like beta-propeller repeat protein [Planctomycetota bacterium]